MQAAAPLEEVARAIVRGDRAAEAEFVHRFQRGVRALVRRRLRPFDPDLDDLVQEVFRAVIEKLRAGDVRDPGALPAFVQTTVVFVTNNEFRRRKRQAEPTEPSTLEQVPDEQAAPSASYAREQLAGLLRRLLSELPIARDREALELFYLKEQPTETVCAKLGLKPADFYLVLSRARKRFRELLGERGIREAV
jgi:RNA polymerase sigma-70 factor (ECF subfamily)